jgi:hypothetical protein
VRLVHRHETHWGSTLEESETRGECSDPSYTTIRVRGRDEIEREIEREREPKERERESRKIFFQKYKKARAEGWECPFYGIKKVSLFPAE